MAVAPPRQRPASIEDAPATSVTLQAPSRWPRRIAWTVAAVVVVWIGLAWLRPGFPERLVVDVTSVVRRVPGLGDPEPDHELVVRLLDHADRGDDHGRLRPNARDPRADDLARPGRRRRVARGRRRRLAHGAAHGGRRLQLRAPRRVGGEPRDAGADDHLGHHGAGDRHPASGSGPGAVRGSNGCCVPSSMRCRRSRRTPTCCRSSCSSGSVSRPRCSRRWPSRCRPRSG